MSRFENIVEGLKLSQESMTVARRAMARVFAESTSPLTATQVMHLLSKSGVVVNKTTVYRELRFFEKKGFIRTMQFEERNRRYELTPEDHRHHLICTQCKKIEDVVLHHDLDHVEASIQGQRGFTVQKHALEFYGVCEGCQR